MQVFDPIARKATPATAKNHKTPTFDELTTMIDAIRQCDINKVCKDMC